MRRSILILVSACAGWCAASGAEPSATHTVVLGPFTGFDAHLDPANETPQRVAYYGTDLGWSYEHRGDIVFLFGDTHASERGVGITPLHDDMIGSIALKDWPDGSRITSDHLPTVRLLQVPGTDRLAPIDPGVPLEEFKTPVAGFSNGEREFALFITGKPQVCRNDGDCSTGFACETSLGSFGARADREPGLTLACSDGEPGCNANPYFDSNDHAVDPSGLCVDRSSSLWKDSAFGHTGTISMQHLIAVRSTSEPQRYEQLQRWRTNKFENLTVRPVADFVPGRKQQDYRHAQGANERVFMWGRPGFIGANADGQTLGLYVAYFDMPKGDNTLWHLHYFSGVDAKGQPRFSDREADAIAVDLDSTQSGMQPREATDLVQHMSVVWIDAVKKWVMFYGGGVSKLPLPILGSHCGVIEIFARSACKDVVIGSGALRMRTADDPWGPWSPPQDLIVGGDADKLPLEGQYAAGGVLYHPACKGSGCQLPSAQLRKEDYGWFYGANIIEPWITKSGNGVDVIWEASTWDPYRVVLLKTRIER